MELRISFRSFRAIRRGRRPLARDARACSSYAIYRLPFSAPSSPSGAARFDPRKSHSTRSNKTQTYFCYEERLLIIAPDSHPFSFRLFTFFFILRRAFLACTFGRAYGDYGCHGEHCVSIRGRVSRVFCWCYIKRVERNEEGYCLGSRATTRTEVLRARISGIF